MRDLQRLESENARLREETVASGDLVRAQRAVARLRSEYAHMDLRALRFERRCKALDYQRLYLLKELGGGRYGIPAVLADLAQPPRAPRAVRPRRNFRAAVWAVIALARMRKMAEVWRQRVAAARRA